VKLSKAKYYLLLSIVLIFSCASKTPNYNLPSAGTVDKPEWVGTHRAARDTIFIVIALPREDSNDLDKSVQIAQSELHTILVNELEIILRDYWEEKQSNYSEDEIFQQLSGMPSTLEQIMNHVVVTDGWTRSDEVSILCALDYEEVADVLMSDMNIEDRAFLSYFKRRMDELATRYH